MYMDIKVAIPDEKGRVFLHPIHNVTYVDYVYDRIYKPEKKYNIPKRTTIGKQCEDDPTMMNPNKNYLKYFPDEDLPEESSNAERSSCLRIGSYLVLKKIMHECKLEDMLVKVFGKDSGLFMNLAMYTIITEGNAGQYYPDYAYSHPLMSDRMTIFSDSSISEFLHSITVDQRIALLNKWNEERDRSERIYISYDSTNKVCQSGDIALAEIGHAKNGDDKPVINYSIAYDRDNRDPLFYEDYPGSIVDVSELQYMLGKAEGYGYKNIGFILDRGYFSRENIRYMDRCNYDFIIMCKGMRKLVSKLVLQVSGTFEEKRSTSIRSYRINGITVKDELFPSDERERYFHIFYSTGKHAAEREQLENRIDRMSRTLKKMEGKSYVPDDNYLHYFKPIYWHEGQPDQIFQSFQENTAVIDREIKLCGYFVIITSAEMTAREAVNLYKSRDASEKLFRGDKAYLGDSTLRVQSTESAEAKILIEFVALIIRNRMYACLKDEVEKSEERDNYMTVPAALRELEKIEMVKQLDDVYRLDHALTKTQKTILKAFQMDAGYIKEHAKQLSIQLSAVALGK